MFDPESMIMFPVVLFPIVSVCAFVVPKTPLPVSVVALLPFEAEIEAVGVPPETLRTANLADWDEVPPMAKSNVELLGESRLEFNCQ